MTDPSILRRVEAGTPKDRSRDPQSLLPLREALPLVADAIGGHTQASCSVAEILVVAFRVQVAFCNLGAPLTGD